MVSRSLPLFTIAPVAEIGGAALVWPGVWEGRSLLRASGGDLALGTRVSRSSSPRSIMPDVANQWPYNSVGSAPAKGRAGRGFPQVSTALDVGYLRSRRPQVRILPRAPFFQAARVGILF